MSKHNNHIRVTQTMSQIRAANDKQMGPTVYFYSEIHWEARSLVQKYLKPKKYLPPARTIEISTKTPREHSGTHLAHQRTKIFSLFLFEPSFYFDSYQKQPPLPWDSYKCSIAQLSLLPKCSLSESLSGIGFFEAKKKSVG